MEPFAYRRARSLDDALSAPGDFLAGGTTLLDLAKLEVIKPRTIVDINPVRAEHAAIVADERGLRLGALVSMAEAAEHPAVRNEYPVIAQSLALAASPQLRNMATLGGNVLQRTRCTYFRDVSWTACNKREPGSGCAALEGINRRHAILGVSDRCIATYAGDFGQALVALGASLEVMGRSGARTIEFESLHRLPGETPHLETTLEAGEIITAFVVPIGPWTRRSLFLKIRDRESYDFALASAAVALDLDGETVREARIALGGVSTKPWRSRAAENALRGRRLDEFAAEEAARAAFLEARPRGQNAFKLDLGRRTLVRALLEAKALES
jgi:xanthine dehydrogenase YagS FAD-binding subunit